jgi:hypothetical protein
MTGCVYSYCLGRDQTALCDGFWSGDRATDDPLRHFLDDLRSLYPALPAPFYSLLAALSSTAGSGAGCEGACVVCGWMRFSWHYPALPVVAAAAACWTCALPCGVALRQAVHCGAHYSLCLSPPHFLFQLPPRSHPAAAFANGYLEQLDSLVSMHVLPDPAIEDSGSEGGEVYTRQAVPLPGAHCLLLPDGAAGEVVPLPEGLTSTDSLWTVPAGTDVDQVSLVRWHIALPESTGQRILLARLSGERRRTEGQAGHTTGKCPRSGTPPAGSRGNTLRFLLWLPTSPGSALMLMTCLL